MYVGTLGIKLSWNAQKSHSCCYSNDAKQKLWMGYKNKSGRMAFREGRMEQETCFALTKFPMYVGFGTIANMYCTRNLPDVICSFCPLPLITLPSSYLIRHGPSPTPVSLAPSSPASPSPSSCTFPRNYIIFSLYSDNNSRSSVYSYLSSNYHWIVNCSWSLTSKIEHKESITKRHQSFSSNCLSGDEWRKQVQQP